MTVRVDVVPGNRSRAEVDFSRIAKLLGDDWQVWMNRKWTFETDNGGVLREADTVNTVCSLWNASPGRSKRVDIKTVDACGYRMVML